MKPAPGAGNFFSQKSVQKICPFSVRVGMIKVSRILLARGAYPAIDFTAKPWVMSEKEFRKQPPRGFEFREQPYRTEAASAASGGIVLTPRFFLLPVKGRRHVILHELGHYLSDAMLSDGSAFETWEEMQKHFKYPHVNGQTTPGEVWAELYAIYMENPLDLEWQGWDQLRPLVEDKVRAYGFPLYGQFPV